MFLGRYIYVGGAIGVIGYSVTKKGVYLIGVFVMFM